MRVDELRDKVGKWDSQIIDGNPVADAKYTSLLNQVDYHAANEWRVYLPAEHPDFNSDYMVRLAVWIGNLASETDQKLLLEYALHISFFSHDDFVALYRTALNREVTRWVATQTVTRLDQHGGVQAFQNVVHNEIHQHTWFCPVTDSMDINEFYKVNHLKGIGHRPGFSTLQMLAEAGIPDPVLAQNVINYMANPSLDPGHPSSPLERLVLLEDVVGSASQCLDAVRWALEFLGKPVLFIPLILCPNGSEILREEEKRWGGQLSVQPVIELSRGDLLGPEQNGLNDWPIASRLEQLAESCNNRASLNMDTFGYRNTGCSLATFSNAPDITLPIVHNKPQHEDWEPLFPRVYRD